MCHHTAVSTAASLPTSTFAPLRVAPFRRLWVASIISHMGTFLLLVAAPWLMLELTGSPLMVSLVTASLALPRLLLTLPAGAWADAVDRRILAMFGNWGAAAAGAVLAVLAWQDAITPALLLMLCGALGTGTAVAIPAYQTLIPELVEDRLVPAATALNSAAFNVARAAGPAIGGAFVAAGRADMAFGVDAASFLVVVVMLLGAPSMGQADRAGLGVLRSTRTGLRYVRFTRPLLLMFGAGAAFTLTATSVQTLLPTVVQDDLRLQADAFGYLLGAFGAGALVGALTRERARARVPDLLPWSIAGVGVCGVAFGLAPSPWVAAVALVLGGVLWVWTLTTMSATVQLMAPRWVRGRAVSIYLLAILGVQPFGAVLAGTTAEALGSGHAVAVLCALTVGVGIVASRVDLPVLGEVAPPALPEDWVAPRHEPSVAGTPVVVETTWRIEPGDTGAFFAVLRDLRRHRLRTGAERWGAYRHADDPFRITESFQVHDWDEHLGQHRRLDAEAATTLRRARAFDRDGGPVTVHLAGLDLTDPDGHRLHGNELTQHAVLHAHDGSVPLHAGLETGELVVPTSAAGAGQSLDDLGADGDQRGRGDTQLQ